MNPSLVALKQILEALQSEDVEKIRDAMDRGQAVFDFEEKVKNNKFICACGNFRCTGCKGDYSWL